MDSSGDETNDHTTEYAVLISVIVVGVLGVLIYVIYTKQHVPSDVELTREAPRANRKKGGFSSVSDEAPVGGFDDDINRFLDEVDPSLFQIEGGDDDDDNEEVVF